MNKEKIIIVIAAIIMGALIAGGVLFLYQSSKKINPQEVKSISVSDPSPTPSSGLFLTIDSPVDEQIVDERLIKVTGKTIPDVKILILSDTDEVAAVSADDGSFSTEINLGQSENIIEIVAIAPNGESVKVRRVVSYTTEEF